jgi:cyclopropane fatty-acyl-phospholipid synthase-like methyltransferase
MNKPYSESCEQNRAPILAVLREAFADRRQVLEVGSGTGQHAVYFGAELPHLRWQTADVLPHHAGIRAWIEEAVLPNVLPPLELDVNQPHWSSERYDAVFSANTLHIMSWPEVRRFFQGVGDVMQAGGVLVVYGPFNYNGTFTSESNARFDLWLKQRDPASGVRDFEAVNAEAQSQGLVLKQDIAMPANNRSLIWYKPI